MLSAGTNIEWLVEDLGVLADAAESHTVAELVRRHGRRGVRPGPPRPGHTPLGLRGPRHPARPHPGHRAARAGAGRAGRDRPARRGSGRGGRGGYGPHDRVPPGRRRHERQPDVRPGAGRRHPAARSRCHPCWRRPPSAPASSPGWPRRMWSSLDDIAGSWRPRAVVEPGLRSTGSGGRRRSSAPPAGCPTCPRWTSRVAPPSPGREGCAPSAVRRTRGSTRPIEESCCRANRRLAPSRTGQPRITSREPSAARPVPRRLALSALAALAGGAVATAFAGPAAAQTDTTGPGGTDDTAAPPPETEAAPTTTAPPKQPTEADIELLGFAQSLEFAAAELYGQAIPVLSEEISLEATVFRRHHQAYGEQIGALLGRQAPGVANRTLVEERTPGLRCPHRARHPPGRVRAGELAGRHQHAAARTAAGHRRAHAHRVHPADRGPPVRRAGPGRRPVERGAAPRPRGRGARRRGAHPDAVPDRVMTTPEPSPGVPMSSDAGSPSSPGVSIDRRRFLVAGGAAATLAAALGGLRTGGRGHPGERRGGPAGQRAAAAGQRRRLPADVVLGDLQRHRGVRHAPRARRAVARGRGAARAGERQPRRAARPSHRGDRVRRRSGFRGAEPLHRRDGGRAGHRGHRGRRRRPDGRAALRERVRDPHRLHAAGLRAQRGRLRCPAPHGGHERRPRTATPR